MLKSQVKILSSGVNVKMEPASSKLFILTVYQNDQIIGSIPSPYHVWDDLKELSFITNLLIEEKAEGISHKASLLKNGVVALQRNGGRS
jgi:hypothetical protein